MLLYCCLFTHSSNQVAASASRILAEMGREEAAFSATLSKGQKLLDEMLQRSRDTAATGSSGSSAGAGSAAKPVLPGADAFLLYDSFGFPLELTQVSASSCSITKRPTL